MQNLPRRPSSVMVADHSVRSMRSRVYQRVTVACALTAMHDTLIVGTPGCWHQMRDGSARRSVGDKQYVQLIVERPRRHSCDTCAGCRQDVLSPWFGALWLKVSQTSWTAGSGSAADRISRRGRAPNVVKDKSAIPQGGGGRLVQRRGRTVR